MSADTPLKLSEEQLRAVDPQDSVWLLASAGTGKTQVLTRRVLRLLLREDVEPSQILCLTFTKAAAAEMATRINAVLAHWVRLDATRLARHLLAIGAPATPQVQARARTLFARVLDCPGGGLRIDTIHAFSQWLLANFPGEAGLAPGVRPIEEREAELLHREVLAAMLATAERAGEQGLLDTVDEFVLAKGADALHSWLKRCAGARGLWTGPQGWQPPMRERVFAAIGLPRDADRDWLADQCADGAFDTNALKSCLAIIARWNTKTGAKMQAIIEQWLASDKNARLDTLDDLAKVLFAKNGNAKSIASLQKIDLAYVAKIEAVRGPLDKVLEARALLAAGEWIARALELGWRFALDWEEAKRREGVLDFDDLIELAARLLGEKNSADWIRYKLDRRFDHILIDEAQDTNSAQWKIIFALIDDFFAGESAKQDKQRTIFTVGDYKQAIFGFQGTSPDNFARAKERVAAAMRERAQNAIRARSNRSYRELREYELTRSYRTSQDVLDFVDRALDRIGHEALGLERSIARHRGELRAGLVALWPLVRSLAEDEEEEPPADFTRGEGEGGDSDDSPEWLAGHHRELADRIARQVARWLGDEPLWLEKDGPRRAGPGDIMVLVRRRKELASLIVARLHAHGVPVAGVDRLRLGAPLAVKDLLAALRFASQPLDDLNLANLLASPLIGWSQDDLLAHVPRAKDRPLWDHLRAKDDEKVAATVEDLRQLLRLADYDAPQALLEWILNGPWQGRARLVERLGAQANDPIDELINAAHAFEALHTPSLAGFIHWFEADEGEIKRDPDRAEGLVRVMTVHGAKGLEAPVVILADAADPPGTTRELSLADAPGLGDAPPRGEGALALADWAGERKIPLPPMRKEERAGALAQAHEAQSAEELKEHWRLLYVAMTRAAEALFIAGSLGKKAKGADPDSWYARLEPLFEGEPIEDDIWGRRREWGRRASAGGESLAETGDGAPAPPDWALRPIGPEPSPPRPLAPSALGEDLGSEPPLESVALEQAARRGVLIHRLLERLPEISRDRRAEAARRYLERQAQDLDEEAREEILSSALKVLEDERLAALFGPGALAEAPIAALVGEQVVTGVIDRLLVTEEEILVVDFKTARRPPVRLEEVPGSVLRQLAAYAAALEAIYPDRRVRAAVVYTQTPEIFVIDDKRLEEHKRALARPQQSFSAGDIE